MACPTLFSPVSHSSLHQGGAWHACIWIAHPACPRSETATLPSSSRHPGPPSVLRACLQSGGTWNGSEWALMRVPGGTPSGPAGPICEMGLGWKMAMVGSPEPMAWVPTSVPKDAATGRLPNTICRHFWASDVPFPHFSPCSACRAERASCSPLLGDGSPLGLMYLGGVQ